MFSGIVQKYLQLGIWPEDFTKAVMIKLARMQVIVVLHMHQKLLSFTTKERS